MSTPPRRLKLWCECGARVGQLVQRDRDWWYVGRWNEQLRAEAEREYAEAVSSSFGDDSDPAAAGLLKLIKARLAAINRGESWSHEDQQANLGNPRDWGEEWSWRWTCKAGHLCVVQPAAVFEAAQRGDRNYRCARLTAM